MFQQWRLDVVLIATQCMLQKCCERKEKRGDSRDAYSNNVVEKENNNNNENEKKGKRRKEMMGR